MSNSSVLFCSQRSPFARRIRLALHRLKWPTEEKMVDVFHENPDLLAANPLGMVPTLVTPEHGPIFDSATILEYLDEVTGKIWPKNLGDRTNVRRAATLAEGVIHSMVLYFQEVHMHEAPSPRWVKDHVETVERTLTLISNSPKKLWIDQGMLTQAGWDIAVALEYVDLRLSEMKWKEKFPALIDVVTLAKKDSYFAETTPRL